MMWVCKINHDWFKDYIKAILIGPGQAGNEGAGEGEQAQGNWHPMTHIKLGPSVHACLNCRLQQQQHELIGGCWALRSRSNIPEIQILGQCGYCVPLGQPANVIIYLQWRIECWVNMGQRVVLRKCHWSEQVMQLNWREATQKVLQTKSTVLIAVSRDEESARDAK